MRGGPNSAVSCAAAAVVSSLVGLVVAGVLKGAWFAPGPSVEEPDSALSTACCCSGGRFLKVASCWGVGGVPWASAVNTIVCKQMSATSVRRNQSKAPRPPSSTGIRFTPPFPHIYKSGADSRCHNLLSQHGLCQSVNRVEHDGRPWRPPARRANGRARTRK